MKKRVISTIVCLAILLAAKNTLQGQEKLTYQVPPAEILELADVPPPPSVMMDEEWSYMLFRYRESFTRIEELSQEELRLGGLRLDPKRYIGSRVTYYTDLRIKDLADPGGEIVEVKGLPEKPQMAYFTWSPRQDRIAFTNTVNEGVELWVLDLEKAEAKRLTEPRLNASLGDVIRWFPDGSSLLVKMVSPEREPLIEREEVVPEGPVVSVAEGKEAQNRTYQDLLRDRVDEHNFEQLVTSELHRVSMDGSNVRWRAAAMYDDLSFSPDGEYVMVRTVEKPFSYLVPYYRFPAEINIYNDNAEPVRTVVKVPLIEVLPQGFMATREGRRNVEWRSDRPSTLVFAEALDGGDPEIQVEYRDKISQLEAPFDGTPVELLRTKNRFSGILWGNEEIAIAGDRWWNNRNTKTYLFDPSDPSGEPVVIFDRNYQDVYSDPGRFVTRRNQWGKEVLTLRGDRAFLLGRGYTEEGQFPFLDRLDLSSLETKRLYESGYTDRLERLFEYDHEEDLLLVRIESPSDFPDYYLRDLKKERLEQLTSFENPFRSIQDVHKEVIRYRREDGLELSATLYLPVGYDMQSKEKRPLIMWAYPREYKDRASAGQTTSNPNEFTYPHYGSPLFWLTRGFVILDDAAFPVVGEGEEEPNDTFRKQLVANARAAIEAVDSLGYIDPQRVAVGGHSYGAFMVANLLSHSDLFAAGIARSGAYNRTLTPFGFQSEERTYWEAPEVYYRMSPFMHADKMKTPLLLIHGEADNNSGTYPLQSKRYFNALKGLGATARLVMLPLESHGYRAKESILHMLWEQDRWLERYLK